MLIGELLIRAGFISLGQLADALPIAKKSGLPVGRVLIGHGYLTESLLREALVAQSMIRDEALSPDTAADALISIKEEGITLDVALQRLQWKSEYHEFTNKLGQLLLSADLLDEPKLKGALQTCLETGLPLGRILVLQGIVTEVVAYAALTAQVLIRDRKITRQQATQALITAADRGTSLEESLERHGFAPRTQTQTLRLGELLILAGIVSEIDLLSAVEEGLVEEIPIGQILLQHNLLNKESLEIALELQRMVQNQIIDPIQATDVLRLCSKKNLPLHQALEEAGVRLNRESTPFIGVKYDLFEIMALLGIVTHEDIVDAVNFADKIKAPFEAVLLVYGKLDQPTLSMAKKVQFLLNNSLLTAEQCVFAVHTCMYEKSDFDQVLIRLNWMPPPEILRSIR